MHVREALARLQAGDPAAAEAALQPVLSRDPAQPDALFAQGLCREAQGRPAEAEAAYRAALAARPDFAEARCNLAAVLTRSGRPEEAVALLDELLTARPDFLAARFNRGTALYALRRLDAAEADFRAFLERQPGHPGAMNELGRVLLTQTRLQEAAELFREGHAQHPQDPGFLANLAGTLERLNDLTGAEAALEKALALKPDAPALLYQRACLAHRQGRLDEARTQLEVMLTGALTEEQRSETLFERGEVLDKLGETAAAFASFTEGNALRAGSPADRNTDGGRFLARVAQAREGFTQERIAALAARAAEAPVDARPAPVFFVGFPRSGTTLMERALKAHPEMVTSDERSPLTPILAELSQSGGYPADLERLTGKDIAALREKFWAAAEATLGPLEGRWLVDKMPLNIVNLGLANGLFPSARVLVALRDPRDACLSCFMQRFQFSDAMANFADLARSAETYGAVMELWLQYRERLSLPWLEYRYEDLVADFEGTLRQVLDFLELPWRDEVLAYSEGLAEQVITTPSYRQVGGALDSRAAGRWRRYQDELAPILPTLQPLAEAFGYSQD